MFFFKRIKRLEEQVAALKIKTQILEDRTQILAERLSKGFKEIVELISKTKDLPELISMHKELDFIKKVAKDLVAYDNILSLDDVAFGYFLEKKSEEEIKFFTKSKENYEKRLRKFIRSVVNKKKMVKTDNKNGKENNSATK